jgi:hypothetical protein
MAWRDAGARTTSWHPVIEEQRRLDAEAWVKAVFTHKAASIYDDKPEERYHFPETYLRQAEAAVDDFILYYEPGRWGCTIAAAPDGAPMLLSPG